MKPIYKAGILASGPDIDVYISTPTCLQMRGIFIGTIAVTSPSVPCAIKVEEREESNKAGRTRNTIMDVLEIYDKHNSFSDGGMPLASVTRALIADKLTVFSTACQVRLRT